MLPDATVQRVEGENEVFGAARAKSLEIHSALIQQLVGDFVKVDIRRQRLNDADQMLCAFFKTFPGE